MLYPDADLGGARVKGSSSQISEVRFSQISENIPLELSLISDLIADNKATARPAHAPTADELAAHRAMLARLKAPIWLREVE